MLRTPSNFRLNSIGFRLLAAFSLIGLMALISALYAWISAADIERKMNKVVSEAMPLIRQSNLLSKDVSSFAMSIGELTDLPSKSELNNSIIQLRSTSDHIQSEIDYLFSLNFERQFIKELQTKVDRLNSNMDAQYTLSLDVIDIRERLQFSLDELAGHQDSFLKIARPRISQGYADFLDEGHKIGKDLRDFVASIKSGETEADLKRIDKKLRIGFETLINTSAGEMRANLEMVALTFLISGLLHEAAETDSLGTIADLEQRFKDTTPLINRIRLILSYATPENNQILISAFPILSAGSGDNSIFNLRRKEISIGSRSKSNSEQAILLSDQLAADVTFLARASEQYTDRAVSSLQRGLLRYNIYAAIAALITIIIAFGIGLFYVNSRVIRRIGLLRETMEKQADGKDAPIPSDSYQDEITDMTRALEVFAVQREEAGKKLQRILISLNEAQQLAQIGNCERNHATLHWRWSEGFYHIIDYSQEELRSTEENFWQVVYPEDRPKVRDYFNTLSSSEEAAEIEFRLIRKDDSIITVTALWKLTEEDRRFTQHGTIQDISERKILAEELLKSRKMESISVLAGGIAHDFNNLLTGIIGNLSMAARVAGDNLPVLEHLRLSELAAIRARDLTKKLLTFSSGGNPVKSITYLPQLLKETAEFALSGSNVSCRYSIDHPLWPVDMDSSHINQIVQNLVVNADHAMKDGGIIYISCSNCPVKDNEISQLSSGDYVKITVSDSGEGIEPSHLNRIFDPYYTTKGLYTEKGSGLGLAIVHGITTKHGGAVQVKSQLGKGSDFSVYIPALPHENISDHPAEKEIIPTGSGGVLVMDDEKFIRDVTTQMLNDLGYFVYTAKDGHETLKLYDTLIEEGRKIDVIIMDLTIQGGMGGEETIARLLEKHPTAKVIVSSGYSNDQVIENYRSYGFCDILNKPYKLAEIAAAVGRAANSG